MGCGSSASATTAENSKDAKPEAAPEGSAPAEAQPATNTQPAAQPPTEQAAAGAPPAAAPAAPAEQAAAPPAAAAAAAPADAQPAAEEAKEEADPLEEFTLDLSERGLTATEILAEIKKTGKGDKLQVLTLVRNKLTQVPEEILKMSSVTDLDVSENELSDIVPICTQMTQLKALNVSMNANLSELPKEIAAMTSLERLSFYGGQKKCSSLPDELYTLSQLQELNLYNNALFKVSDKIGGLTSLRDLNLASNKLKTLPAGVLENMVNLQSLSLFWNKIMMLPSLAGLVNLESWKMYNNMLQELPTLGTHAKLTELSLNKNDLTVIPEDAITHEKLPSLEVLEINNNKLTAIPTSIAGLVNLTKLSVDGNQIPSLPVEVYSMPNLSFLSIDGNKFTEVPPEISKLQPKLASLYLANNQIPTIPPCLGEFAELVRFSIKGCPLTPDNQPTLEKIKVIIGAKKNGKFIE